MNSVLLKAPLQTLTHRGSAPEVRTTVEQVISDIRERGDEAVREYSKNSTTMRPRIFG